MEHPPIECPDYDFAGDCHHMRPDARAGGVISNRNDMDAVKQKIIELVPEISKCTRPFSAADIKCSIEEHFRPITLADVLRAIRKAPNGIARAYGSDGDILTVVPSVGHEFDWNLATDYDGQTQEVKEFVGRLIGVV